MGWVKGMDKGEWVKGMESALRLSLFVIPAVAGLSARHCVSCMRVLCFWAQPGSRPVLASFSDQFGGVLLDGFALAKVAILFDDFPG